jgi:hypothetical protein
MAQNFREFCSFFDPRKNTVHTLDKIAAKSLYIFKALSKPGRKIESLFRYERFSMNGRP